MANEMYSLIVADSFGLHWATLVKLINRRNQVNAQVEIFRHDLAAGSGLDRQLVSRVFLRRRQMHARIDQIDDGPR